MSIDVTKEIESVKTTSEFDAIVERMKVSHPLKYEARLKSGDLAKQRNALIDDSSAEVNLATLSKAELVGLAKDRGIELTGSETKAELLEKLK